MDIVARKKLIWMIVEKNTPMASHSIPGAKHDFIVFIGLFTICTIMTIS